MHYSNLPSRLSIQSRRPGTTKATTGLSPSVKEITRQLRTYAEKLAWHRATMAGLKRGAAPIRR